MKFIYNLIDKFKLWKKEKTLYKEIERSFNSGSNSFTRRSILGEDLSNININNIELIYDIKQHKYREGVVALKRNLKDVFKEAKDIKDLDEFLGQVDDMIEFATEENYDTKLIRNIREQIIVRKNLDVKNKKDEKKRAEARVEDYKALHNNIEKRTLQRMIRFHQRHKNDDKVKELMREFEEKYGNK